MLFTQLILLHFFVLLNADSETAQDTSGKVDVFEEISSWRGEVEDPEKYAGLLGDDLEATFKPKSPAVISLLDLHDFTFSGSTDDAGLPHGNGTLQSDDDSGHTEFCVRRVCRRAVAAVYADFEHGRTRGPAWVIYQDGGVTVAQTRQSVMHGVFKDFLSGGRRVVVIGVRANGRAAVGTPLWVMDNDGSTGAVGRADEDGALAGDGCVFHFDQKVAVCGTMSNGVITSGRVCRDFAPAEREHGILAPPKCVALDDGGALLSFGLPSSSSNASSLAAAQSTWMRLHLVDERPKSIFMDGGVARLRELDGVSRPLETHVGNGPQNCRHKLDLRTDYPRDTFWEWGFISYPGSGSKWAHSLMTYLTGIRNFELWIEHEPSYKVGSTLFIKSHHQSAAMYMKVLTSKVRSSEDMNWRLQHIMRFGGRAVVLLRNPYDAVVSYWNHANANEHSVLPNMVEHLQGDDFRKFAMVEIEQWLEVLQDWVTMSPHVLVLHFERLKQRGEERTAELRRVLEHLGLEGDEEMQARAECLGEVEVGGHHKRQGRPRLPEDAFTDDIRKRFDEIIDQAQTLLKSHNHQEIPLEKYRFYAGNVKAHH